MKILFELDNGEYVVELVKDKLYARITKNSAKYASKVSSLFTDADRGKFHEYQEEDKKLFIKLKKVIANDLKDVVS